MNNLDHTWTKIWTTLKPQYGPHWTTYGPHLNHLDHNWKNILGQDLSHNWTIIWTTFKSHLGTQLDQNPRSELQYGSIFVFSLGPHLNHIGPLIVEKNWHNLDHTWTTNWTILKPQYGPHWTTIWVTFLHLKNIWTIIEPLWKVYSGPRLGPQLGPQHSKVKFKWWFDLYISIGPQSSNIGPQIVEKSWNMYYKQNLDHTNLGHIYQSLISQMPSDIFDPAVILRICNLYSIDSRYRVISVWFKRIVRH